MSPKHYRGYTHPVPMWALGLWKRLFCSRDMHAFDEVADAYNNYLSCDGCGLTVFIDVDGEWKDTP